MKPWEMRRRFGAAPAPGGGDLPTVTWNPFDRAGPVVLTSGDLTAECNSNGAFYSIRATHSKSVGKHYFEVHHDVATPANYNLIGVCTAAHSMGSGQIADDASGWAYYEQTGQVFHNATGASYGSTYTAGDVIGVALDLDAGKLWFSKNGAWQASGNPAAGTGEAYSSVSGTLFPALSMYSGGGVNAKMTARFRTSDFSYSPPAGFGPYGG